jgi:hypothetical protein
MAIDSLPLPGGPRAGSLLPEVGLSAQRVPTRYQGTDIEGRKSKL